MVDYPILLVNGETANRAGTAALAGNDASVGCFGGAWLVVFGVMTASFVILIALQRWRR
jgi:hypothetical protein